MHNMNNVVYRDLDASQALTSTIDKKLKKLNRISSQIQSSRVVLDSPHQHKHKGKLYRAQIELGVKGNSFTLHQDDTSIHVAVRDVFKAAERKLKEVTAKQNSKPSGKNILDLVESPEDNELH
ncbi:HPF/RaiA family ribosome-associated protein [Aestuariicella sp. G3-2]|uniref:HPF/RaiA family ribosome-associated protein n=1 Tax=Pseudomaricurvus albidus TaxID=2842452 RepID=UPI001C0E34AB|nr:HPF/RaiA family ribosome-associated protein [Aestuariicella albida]MBU3070063.1 HPF/RaiA family ribosome-associated protein [Aestuariicella albida]